MSAKFIKKVEDFVCENCGLLIKGHGYTNHCPRCLYSKHVDIFPGDRAEPCQGLMRPIGLKIQNGKESIVHKCTKCGITRINKRAKDDYIETIIEISKFPVK